MSIPSRPDWEVWAMGIARAVSLRGDCTRRRVGAVLLDTRHRLIGAGYNGTEPGGKSCLKGDCPRGRHYRLADAYAKVCKSCPGGDWICSDCRLLV